MLEIFPPEVALDEPGSQEVTVSIPVSSTNRTNNLLESQQAQYPKKVT
jgi:hypothetical protein